MLQVNQPTDEQTKNENTRQGELHKSVKDTLLGNKIQGEILKDLGLSPGEVEESKESSRKQDQESSEEEGHNNENQNDEVEQEESDNSQEDENSEDEEVIPKSKVQKRFDELTAKLKFQERQIEELRLAKTPETKDEISKQLETMTQEQLKAAKLEVRKAQIKSQDDDAKLNELLALEDRIDNALNDAPKNFVKAQVDAYERKAKQIIESGEIKDLEKAGPEIMKLAAEIYSEYPLLQKDIKGQATALELAVKHYKAISSTPGDKNKETDLKRQVNNLKRKTTLDTKVVKGNMDKSKLDTLRKNAIGGTMRQKVALVKSHPMFNVDAMIPDEFK